MSLSIDQIAQIKAFINKRGFNTIEVEMEALDHMASKIEALLEEKPDMNFDLAITKAHADLGIFGFATFEEAIYEGFRERQKRLKGAIFRSYFQGQKTLIPMSVILVGWFISKSLLTYATESAIVTSIYGYGLILVLFPVIHFKKVRKKWGKKSLVVSNALVNTSLITMPIMYSAGIIAEMSVISSLLFNVVFILSFFALTFNVLVSYPCD